MQTLQEMSVWMKKFLFIFTQYLWLACPYFSFFWNIHVFSEYLYFSNFPYDYFFISDFCSVFLISLLLFLKKVKQYHDSRAMKYSNYWTSFRMNCIYGTGEWILLFFAKGITLHWSFMARHLPTKWIWQTFWKFSKLR